jgi:hypothetical protein
MQHRLNLIPMADLPRPDEGRHAMTTLLDPGLTRAERLLLAAAALRGALAGAARAITTWLLDQYIH